MQSASPVGAFITIDTPPEPFNISTSERPSGIGCGNACAGEPGIRPQHSSPTGAASETSQLVV